MTKSVAAPLNTVPVGPPGTETVSACLAPLPLYSVVAFLPLSDTHHGVVGPAERPHPLTSVASAVSDTRLWTVKTSSAMPPNADPAMSSAAASAAAMRLNLRMVLPLVCLLVREEVRGRARDGFACCSVSGQE